MAGFSISMVMIIFWVFYAIFILVLGYVLPALFTMRIFKKAGVKPWIAWVPFYNQWKFLQIGGYNGALIFILVGGLILYIVGFVLMMLGGGSADSYYGGMNWALFGTGILLIFVMLAAVIVYTVFQCLAAYQIGKKLGKDGTYVLLYIFFSIIWMGILGFDKSKWDDSKGKKSLA